MTLLVHEGFKAENAYAKDGTLPDPSSTDNAEFKIVLTIIKRTLPQQRVAAWGFILGGRRGGAFYLLAFETIALAARGSERFGQRLRAHTHTQHPRRAWSRAALGRC